MWLVSWPGQGHFAISSKRCRVGLPIRAFGPRASGRGHPPFLENCATMRRDRSVAGSVLKLWNETGTNRARIADSQVSEFVHGHISWHQSLPPPDRVAGRVDQRCNALRSVKIAAEARANAVDRRARASGRARAPRHCVLTTALPGCGTEMNWIACRAPTPIGVGTETR